MANKRAAKRRAYRARLRLRQAIAAAGPWYCLECSKIVWPTIEDANKQVEHAKSDQATRRPDLLEAYPCPHGKGWHLGHNYMLAWTSLCVGEHK